MTPYKTNRNEVPLSERDKNLIRANDKVEELNKERARLTDYLQKANQRTLDLKAELNRQYGILTELTSLVDKYEKELADCQNKLKRYKERYGDMNE